MHWPLACLDLEYCTVAAEAGRYVDAHNHLEAFFEAHAPACPHLRFCFSFCRFTPKDFPRCFTGWVLQAPASRAPPVRAAAGRHAAGR